MAETAAQRQAREAEGRRISREAAERRKGTAIVVNKGGNKK